MNRFELRQVEIGMKARLCMSAYIAGSGSRAWFFISRRKTLKSNGEVGVPFNTE
jgi:hypothetical protein